MKKILYLMLLMLMPTVVSCSDEDDLPDVSYTLTLSNTENVDGTIYIVQGDTLLIDKLEVTNNEAGKNAVINQVTYYFDYMPFATRTFYPYAAWYPTDKLPEGTHALTLEVDVLAEGKSYGVSIVNYPVEVVQNPDQIPITTAIK